MRGNVGIEAAVGRVIFQEMGERSLSVRSLTATISNRSLKPPSLNGLVDLPADTTKPVDAYPNCHDSSI